MGLRNPNSTVIIFEGPLPRTKTTLIPLLFKQSFEVGKLYSNEIVRESSFNMTRGGMKILRGGSEKIRRGGGSENLYTLNPKGGGLLKN